MTAGDGILPMKLKRRMKKMKVMRMVENRISPF
jgi:hypothetical protein